MSDIYIKPTGSFQGEITVPGDKSISHRAIMFSALAQGTSHLKGLLLGEDVLSTIECFRQLGVSIEIGKSQVMVHGVGLQGLKAPAKPLYCGNSGTTFRLLMGLLAGQAFTTYLTGDESLNQRPMGRVIEPLSQMGAQIEEMRASPKERVIKIIGKPLRGIDYTMPIASAQVKSALLLAGLWAQGEIKIRGGGSSRDHTEVMLQGKGVSLKKDPQQNLLIFSQKPSSLPAQDLEIPGDISSAAFFLVGGLLGTQSKVMIKNVGINPTRTGILEALEAMGAFIHQKDLRQVGGEKVADLEVKSQSLKATLIEGDLIPRLVDEIPILSVAAAQAEGLSEVRDAAELRVKESDRIASTEEELGKLQVFVQSKEDGWKIKGPQAFKGGQVQSHGDHRLAMTLAIAGNFASAPVKIQNIDPVATSYPQFWEHFKSLGGQYQK
ncbi:MAG: 3-phosphoshikimate 1-carboxyvinyltransferase [Deltaproteobacteria bacterium]|nr:3-phosphoshikimate 1-carboxyvinyltransferase [Deltaproteobacteria bacterium]